MFAAPTSISNYFKVFRIDDWNTRSDPPYIGGVSVPDRLYGGLALSQVVQSLLSLNSNLVPHTANYKFISPASTNIPLEFKFSLFEDGKVASVRVFQNGKLMGIAHVRSTTEPDYLDSSPYLCPDYGPPESFPRVDELPRMGQGHKFVYMQELSYFPMEIRTIETPLFPKGDVERHTNWLRMKPQFHDTLKPTDGVFVLIFISDLTMLQVGNEIYEKRKIKPLAWYLVIVECHIISHARAKLESCIFNEQRKCVMSVVQEGYFLRAKEGKL